MEQHDAQLTQDLSSRPGSGPLGDLRVIEVAEYGAGPMVTELFAHLGADVIKIESPVRGDSSRYVPPFQEGDDSLFFQSCNRNKRSIAVDLKSDAGQEILHKIVATADAVFTNVRPRAVERLGLRFEHLRRANPAIVCFLLSGWGREGPRANRPAYDYTLQAYGGQMSLNAEMGDEPRRSSTAWVDTSTSFLSAFGLLAGIHAAKRTGVGSDGDASMIDAATYQWMYLSTWYLNRDYVPAPLRRSGHSSVVPSQLFAVSDGHIMVMCQTEQFWLALCEALGRDDLRGDLRFKDMRSRFEHREALEATLQETFGQMTRAEALSLLEGRVAVEAVQTFPEAMESYRAAYPGSIVEFDHPDFGPIETVAAPVHVDGWSPDPRAAPSWGEHTHEILLEVGYAPDDLEHLGSVGVIRGR